MTLLRVLSLLLAGCGILVLSGAWRRDSKNDRLGKQPTFCSLPCVRPPRPPALIQRKQETPLWDVYGQQWEQNLTTPAFGNCRSLSNKSVNVCGYACVCVSMCVHVCVLMNVCMCVCVCSTCVCVYVRISTSMCMCMCMCVRLCGCLCVSMSLCMCVCIRVCVHVHVCTAVIQGSSFILRDGFPGLTARMSTTAPALHWLFLFLTFPLQGASCHASA